MTPIIAIGISLIPILLIVGLMVMWNNEDPK
jgi:hypothetical protein